MRMRNLCYALFLISVSSIQAFQSILVDHRRFLIVTTTSRLEVKKVKRKSLGSLTDEDSGLVASVPKRNRSTRSNTSTKQKSGRSNSAGVSSDLAQWAAASQTTDTTTTNGNDDASVDNQTASRRKGGAMATEFAPFESSSSKSDRRIRQSERLQIDKAQDEIVRRITEELEETLQGSNNLQDILSATRKLLQQEQGPTSSLKALTSGSAKSTNYRLAWVGSDDAICHIGTGLHKVPLARLQEIFLTLKGKSRLEVYEVISVFGPFPNVRNTLQGSSSVSSGIPSKWNVVYDSMIDGTGKEILAGKDESRRKIGLEVYFADQNAIVAVVPPKTDGLREDPLEDNGSNVLLFLREDDLDEKLDALRVL